MSDSLAYQAFELYCFDARGGKFTGRLPANLTFENWIKTSSKVQEYIEKAIAILRLINRSKRLYDS